MKKRRQDIPWYRKEIIFACIILYAITLVYAYYWVTDSEMPYKLQTFIFGLSVLAPTCILMNLKSILKNVRDPKMPPRE